MNAVFEHSGYSEDAFMKELKALKSPFDNSVLERRLHRLENVISDLNTMYKGAC